MAEIGFHKKQTKNTALHIFLPTQMLPKNNKDTNKNVISPKPSAT